jgi:hypothetical protein
MKVIAATLQAMKIANRAHHEERTFTRAPTVRPLSKIRNLLYASIIAPRWERAAAHELARTWVEPTLLNENDHSLDKARNLFG